MAKYVLKRLMMAVLVLFGVVTIVFIIMRAFSSDPAASVLGQHATAESMAAWRASYGLDKPLWEQYVSYLAGLLHGDLGYSYYDHTSVAGQIMGRFPATIELAVCAILIAGVFGIALGVAAAVHKRSFWDYFSTVVSLVGVSMPVFWLGILLIILFAGSLHVLPSTGRIDPMLQPVGGTGFYLLDTLLSGDFEAFGNALAHMILPSVTLAMYSLAIICRMTRSSMLDTLDEDYVRTARAKGVRRRRVQTHHALRNAMLPVTTVIGLELGSLLGGAMLTETIFAWPGIGKLAVDAIQQSDYPVVQGVVLLIGVIYVLMNIVVDVVYAYLDPRITYTKEEG
ncbi:ABC transporter permease [Enorma massiliensis]|uniref:ABC transporter permease n=1 Tax=Enorma massiliensis TaxID=1472761 RepID=UPI0003094CEE|nr:ABC transporter permease [Enorma massiliensis]